MYIMSTLYDVMSHTDFVIMLHTASLHVYLYLYVAASCFFILTYLCLPSLLSTCLIRVSIHILIICYYLLMLIIFLNHSIALCVWCRANREMREERNMFGSHRDDDDDNMQYTANVRQVLVYSIWSFLLTFI